MATILGDDRRDIEGLELRRPWQSFSESERRRMLKDDIQAGVTVALILTGVLLGGLLIGLIGVTLSF